MMMVMAATSTPTVTTRIISGYHRSVQQQNHYATELNSSQVKPQTESSDKHQKD